MPDDPGYAFFATPVGEKGSKVRQRADDITDYILKPLLKDEFGLELRRADRDPSPGQITPKMLRTLLEARLVIADLTGRNANVYYEVAVAHSFSKPVVALIDDVGNVAFDVKDERLIAVHDNEGDVSVRQAQEAISALQEALRVVLADDFRPSSVVADVANARSIDDLTSDDPMASELAAIRNDIIEIKQKVRPRVIRTGASAADMRVLREHLERIVTDYDVPVDDLAEIITEDTSLRHDRWAQSAFGVWNPFDLDDGS